MSHRFPLPADSAEPWEQLELSWIKAIELAAATMPDVVSLAQGIPSFDTPDVIKSLAKQKLDEGACAKYSLSPGLPALRELIAEELRRAGMSYDPEGEILVTCGSIEAIAATLLALVPPGAEVLLPSPTYTSYYGVIQLAGAVPRFVPLSEDSGFDLDPEVLTRSFNRKTKAVLLAQPNNPTGTIFPRATLELVVQTAERFGATVITDEVYKDFVYTQEPVPSPAQFTAHRHHVVRVCSFSKAFAMTGWRVGFLHSDRSLASRILKVHDSLVTCAPVISQYAAMAALEHADTIVAPFREHFRQRRARILEHLDSMPDIFDYQKPQGSYFVFPRLKDTVPLARDSRALAHQLLHQARVAVVPGIAFGPTGEGHVRLCFARRLEDIDTAFERIRHFFQLRPTSRTVSLPVAAPQPLLSSRQRWRRRLAAGWFSTLARIRLKRHRPLILGIAGARGKTVAKRVLVELLSRCRPTRANPLSYNTEIGLPLAVLGIRLEPYDGFAPVYSVVAGVYRALFPVRTAVLVLEYGVRQPGDANRLLRVVTPDILVLTPTAGAGVYDEHSVQSLREELARLVSAAASRGAPIFACADDPFVDALGVPPTACRIAANFDPQSSDVLLTASAYDQEFFLRREVVGVSELYAIRTAFRVAERLGVPVDTLRQFAAGLQPRHD